jgi:O-antigen/teichoic acid export membrane protein
VRWPGDLERAARSAVTVAIGSSLIMYVLCFVAAPWFAAALNAPEATALVRLLSLGVIIDGISSVPNALLTRSFLQGRRTAADFVALGISSGLSVLMALSGFGAWSLVWGRLAGNAIGTGLILRLAPSCPRPGFNWPEVRALTRFGLPLAGASLLVFAMLNLDYVVVGHVLGPLALGFYVIASNLSGWPTNLLSVTVRRVSIAGFGELQHDRESLEASFVRSFALLLAVALPACALLAVLGHPLVRTLYGPRWDPAVSALQFLAILGCAKVALNLCYDLLVATGRSRVTMVLQGLWVAALIPALTAGARLGGLRGVAIGHALVVVVLVIPGFLLALRGAGISLQGLAAPLLRPALGCVLAAGVAQAIVTLVHGDLLDLVLGGVAAAAVYLAVVWPAFRLVRS